MIKNLIVLFSYLTIIPLFSGCLIYGPIYTKPKINEPKTWKTPDQLSRIEKVNLPMMAWWQKFEDKELTYLIEKEVLNNNNIQAAVGHVTAAQGELLQIQFSWLPSLNALLLGYSSSNINLFLPGYSSGFLPTYALNLFFYLYLYSLCWSYADDLKSQIRLNLARIKCTGS